MPANTRTEFRDANPRGRDKRTMKSRPYTWKDDDWRWNVRRRRIAISPFRGRVGNGRSVKRACRHCNPKLINRVEKNFDTKNMPYDFALVIRPKLQKLKCIIKKMRHPRQIFEKKGKIYYSYVYKEIFPGNFS